MRLSDICQRVPLFFLIGVFALIIGILPHSAEANWYEGDELGYLDLVKVNDSDYEELDAKEIIFYKGDLLNRNGKVEISGLLDSEAEGYNPSELVVQISLNGGKSWNNATGDESWSYIFEPKLEVYYDLSIRLVKRGESDDAQTIVSEEVLPPNPYYLLGDFLVKIAADKISEAGEVAAGTVAHLSGLPDVLLDELPSSLLNAENELSVVLDGFKVNLATGSVTLGTIVANYSASPIEIELGPANLQISGLSFSTSSASIAGNVSLTDLGLPTSNLPFTDLYLGRDGIAGEIDLVGGGSKKIEIVEGDYGFGLDLEQLVISIDSRKPTTQMASIKTFAGGLFFGSGFGGIKVPDLELMTGNLISWGNSQVGAASASRLTLPGGLFSIGDLGGNLNLSEKLLTINGTIFLPPSLGSASLTIPASSPITLSAKDGLSTDGQIDFSPGNLPAISLAHIDTTLTGLSLGLDQGMITGDLLGDLNFPQFGGLKVAVVSAIDSTGLKDLKIDSGNLQKKFELQGFAKMNLDKVVAGYKNENFYVQLDGNITPTHDLLSDYKKKVVFEGLRIFKSGIEFVGQMDGWHETSNTSISINNASVKLEEYGLGVHEQALWFGLKGSATVFDNKIDLTAKIFQDGTFEVSDLNFDGLSFSLGQFKLRTGVKVVDGIINGQGFINLGVLSKYIPESLKDPLTDELLVDFENLGVDLVNKKITSGHINVDFSSPLQPDFGILAATINSIQFGIGKASIDGSFRLDSLAGIELPSAITDLSVDDINFSPAGFTGELTKVFTQPVKLPVLAGQYGIALNLSEFAVDINTSATDILDIISLKDLDGQIKLGSGYDLKEPLQDLQMLADGAITWGAQTVAEGQAAVADAQNAVDNLASGISFTIPNTSFVVNNFNGRLYLEDKEMKVWGSINLPASLGSASVELTESSALVLSTEGVSTDGAVSVDVGTLTDGFQLGGFGAIPSSFSLGVLSNEISGAIAGDINLSMFRDIPIGVSASLDNKGLKSFEITAEEINETFILADFADLTITGIGGGYENGEGFVDIDGTLALSNTNVNNLSKTFDFKKLHISPSALSLPDMSKLYEVNDVSFSVNTDALAMSLEKYGFKVKDNLFWLTLSGEVTLFDNDIQASAKISHKGDFEFDGLSAKDLVIAIGEDCTLTGSFEYVDGHIEQATAGLHLGSIMNSIDASFKDVAGRLPVRVSNLDFEMVDGAPVLTSGTVRYAPGGNMSISTDLFQASFSAISVGMNGGAFFADVEGAAVTFTSGVLAGLEGLSVSDISLLGGGLQGTVSWSSATGQTLNIVDHEQYGIDALLTGISAGFDSRVALASMVTINSVDGSLNFGTGYKVPNFKPAISFDPATHLYSFDAAGKALSIAKDLKIQNMAGGIDFDSDSLNFSGQLAIPLGPGVDKQITFDISNWSISSSGIAGSVSAANVDLSETIGFNSVLLKNADIGFDAFSLQSASLAMDITLEQFFDLKVASSLAVDSEGVKGWAINTEASPNLTASIGFADLTVENLAAGYDSGTDDSGGRGLFFTLDSNVAFNGAGLLSGITDELTLSGIEVSGSGIAIDEVAMDTSFNGTKASLAGVDLSLETLGLGYDGEKAEGARFFVNAFGGLSVGPIAADAGVTVFQNLTVELTEIQLEYAKGPVYFSGGLGISESEFSATIDGNISGMIIFGGEFIMGSADTYSYWGVTMSGGGGSGVPLAPLPLSLFELGGGLAYNMTVDQESGKLTKDGSKDFPFVLLATAGIGTPDATTWYGRFTLSLASSKITLQGDSWFLSETHSGTPDLAGKITIGSSPAMLHVSLASRLEKKIGSMTMLGVDGEVDLLFSESDWHIWFGSKDQSLSVTALEYIKGAGYLQLSGDGLAVGVRQTFDIGGEWWIFYGRVYGGAEVAIEGGFVPFYIDARGKIWVGLEAGVRIDGDDWEIMSAYASLEARFRAPNPTFVMMHGEMRYSFLGGFVNGNWEMDFTIPDSAEGASMVANISDLPLLATTIPKNNATKVGIIDYFEISTTIPIMRPFEYDDGQWYVLCVEDPQNPGLPIDFTTLAGGNNALLLNGYQGSVVGGLLGMKRLAYHTIMPMFSGQEYTISTNLELRRFRPGASGNYGLNGSVGDVVKEENVSVAFTTTDEELKNLREFILGAYPKASTTPVYAGTNVYLEMKNPMAAAVFRAKQQNNIVKVNILDPSGTPIEGVWDFGNTVTDDQGGSQRSMFKFEPAAPLYLMKSYTDDKGVKKYVKPQSNGTWKNPFLAETEQKNNVRSNQKTQGKSNREARGSGRSRTEKKGSGGSVSIKEQARFEEKYKQKANFDVAYENKYTIEIIGEDNKKQFGSNFYLTLPENDEAFSSMHASTEAVIKNGGIENPHFFINYSIDQNGYQQAIASGPELVKREELRGIWERFITSSFSSGGESCQPDAEAPEEFLRQSFDRYFGNAMNDLELCVTTATMVEAVEERFNAAKAELALDYSTVDFKSLELRFTTQAPINWNEIELVVDFSPDLSIISGGDPSLIVKRDQYIVRSKGDSLEHRVELKLGNNPYYTSGMFLIEMDQALSFGNYREGNISDYGSFEVYTRDFTGSSLGADYNYSTDENINNVGSHGNSWKYHWVGELKTTRGNKRLTNMSDDLY